MIRSFISLVCLAASAVAEPRLDQHGDPLPEGAIVRFGTIRHRIGSQSAVRSWALSPDGKTFAAEDRRGITLWDVESGKPVKSFSPGILQHEPVEFGLQFSADGKFIARLGGRVVSVFDANTGKVRWSHDLKKLG